MVPEGQYPSMAGRDACQQAVPVVETGSWTHILSLKQEVETIKLEMAERLQISMSVSRETVPLAILNCISFANSDTK